MKTLNLPLSKTPEQLFDFIRSIRSREMRSNSQWNMQSLTKKYNNLWIGIQNEIALVLFLDNENIIRLTYYVKNVQSLTKISKIIPKVQVPVMCDLLGKEPEISSHAEEVQTVFSPYAQYRRMICTDLNINNSIDISGVELAKMGDETEILEMLHEEFDPLTARIPKIEMICSRIKNEDILIVRRNNHIAGFINFNSKNQKVALLDYVVVRPEYRNQHIAKKIWNYKLKEHNESKYFYLWVNMARTTAIHFHKSNGFHFDGLVDYIFKVN